MKNTYQQVLWVYLNNRTFVVLLGIFFVSALLSKILYHAGFLFYAEEVFTLLFVSTLWFAFYFGMLIKHHIAHHRSSLIPHYRLAHIKAMITVFIMMAFLSYLWEFAYKPVLEVSPQGLWGIYFTCLWIAVIVAFLGYLSIARTLMYAYGILFVFSKHAMPVMEMLHTSHKLAYVMGFGCVFFTAFFIYRLTRLKEDDFEYAHVLSWPLKRSIVNQIRASQSLTETLNPLKKIFNIKKRTVKIPPYYQEPNVFYRSYHWEYAQHVDVKAIWIILLLGFSWLFMLMNQRMTEELLSKDVYANFLLLSITPVVMVISAQYRRLAYMGHDLLKPVSKTQYFKEQGIIVLTHVAVYWLIMAVCFAILPNILFHPELFSAKKFWIFLTLTFYFSTMVTCWLVFLNCVRHAGLVLMQAAALGLLTLYCVYAIPGFSLSQMIMHNFIFLGASMIFCYKAFKGWCEHEMDSK